MRNWRYLALLLILQALYSSAYAESPALALKARTEGGTVRIEIASKAPLHYRAKTITTPRPAILVDVFPARLISRFECTVNSGLIKRVGALQQDPNTVRLTIESLVLPKYDISRGERCLNMLIETNKTMAGKAWPAALVPPPEIKTLRANFDEPQRDFVSISFGDLDEVKDFLVNIFPGTQFVVDNAKGGLQMSGSRLALQQVRELVEVFEERPFLILDVKIAYIPEFVNAHHHWFGPDGAFQGSPGLTWTQFGEYGTRSEAETVRGPVGIGWEHCQAARISTLLSNSEANILGFFRLGVTSRKSTRTNFGDKLPVLYFNPHSG